MRGTQTYVLALLVAGLTLSLVLYPDASLEAARSGLELFLTIVFPSLLPFFILSELMLGLGVVHFIGVLFEPFMRPVFRVPGEGAFALSMGLAAGYPMDAVITARFRKAGMCGRIEGERLLAFTNTADPLFIFGAVAVGMFAMPALGGVLALAHYMSALSVGLIFRFHGRHETPSRPEETRTGTLLGRAVRALVRARSEETRALGRLAGDAVNDSVKTLLMICGFIMLFSAFVAIAGKVGLTPLIGAPFAALFRAVGVDPSLVPAAVAGIFEIDIGTLAASRAAAPFLDKALIAGAIIAWSGLSVHGQVAAVISGTDIRMGPYVAARVLHAVLAAVFTALLLPVLLGPAPVTTGLPAGEPLAASAVFLRALGRGASRAALVTLGVAAGGLIAAIVASIVAAGSSRGGANPAPGTSRRIRRAGAGPTAGGGRTAGPIRPRRP